jgi:prophage maintenance system killer protein
MAVFLELNGYTLSVTDDELYFMALDVANERIALSDLALWIKKHSKPSE